MASFNSHSSIVTRLKLLSDKLASSALTEAELDEFERLSSELYKRAVVLNYKAKEEVFKKLNTEKTKVEEEVIEEEKVIEEPADTKEDVDTLAFDFSDDFVEDTPSHKAENQSKDEVKESFVVQDEQPENSDLLSELFDGSADEFNKTIELLDEQSNSEEALLKLSKIAVEKNWQKEAVSVDEFAHLVIRRYVE